MIYILTNYKYPAGDAGSLRMHSFAKALKKIGHDAKILCHGPLTEGDEVYDGVVYRSLRLSNKYFSYATMPLRMMATLIKDRKRDSVSHVIAGYVSVPTLVMLKTYCRLSGIKLIYDAVEWYAPSQFKHGKRSSRYFWNTLVNSRIVDKNVSVISISTYFHNYYKAKGIRTVRIPIFFKQKEVFEIPQKDKLVNITYAGQPGKKDFVWLMLKAFASLRPETRNKLKFNLIGCSETQVKAMCNEYGINYRDLEEVLVVHGRIPNSQVIEWLGKSHYTILLRDKNERNAQAGFPSKVVESVSNGVPPIMNFSSDLALYFENQKNCIEVQDLSMDSIHAALETAANMTADEYSLLAQNAAKLARDRFNVDSYLTEFKQIF